MTPRFFPRPPLAHWVLLLATLATLPPLGLIITAENQRRQITQQIDQSHQQLQENERQLRRARSAQQRKLKQRNKQHSAPPVVAMLDRLGQAATPDVAIISADVNPQKNVIRLTLRVTSLTTLFAWSERLQQLPVRVTLENHHPSPEKTTDWPVSAVLSLYFQGESDVER